MRDFFDYQDQYDIVNTYQQNLSMKQSKQDKGDRFIHNRGSSNMDYAMYQLNNENNMNYQNTHHSNLLVESIFSQSQKKEEIEQTQYKNQRLLNYGNKQEQPMSSIQILQNNMNLATKNFQIKKKERIIPSVPEKILDAPDLVDDYYLNLLDWGKNGFLAVCLGQSLYLWNSQTGDIQLLMSMDQYQNSDQYEYISSVAWMNKGGANDCLAVGFSNNEIQLWDVVKFQPFRNLPGHTNRVSSLSWNNYILSSGSRDTNIINHDIRQQQNIVSKYSQHYQEVCGLKWSQNGKYLASGGNDNNLFIWDLQSQNPVYKFDQHKAAVKALAWCPWQTNLLASGGGTADKSMKFWNTDSGKLVNQIESDSQFCSIVWSQNSKEILSSHGYSKNQLCIWKYPSLEKIGELTGHTNRVLHLALNPEGDTVVSAAADETLRFWKAFESQPNLNKNCQKQTFLNSTLQNIR